MGKSLRGDPTAVIAELSGWLSNPDSPAIWAPFAFSIRGLAYEVMDECELARMDYMQGLNNMKFMRVRLEALPPAGQSSNQNLSLVIRDDRNSLFFLL